MKMKAIAAMLFMGFAMLSANIGVNAATYYVSNDGNDSAAGLTAETAWKSLEKVSSTEFQPGDEILLKAGDVWNGQLAPQGNGKENLPITIASYGEGAKPIINGNGVDGHTTGGAVTLLNQSWWTIKDIEVTNDAPDWGWRMGILIYNEGVVGEGYVIKNVTVHNVEGGSDVTTRSGDDSHWNGGIVIRSEATKKSDNCRTNNVLIEDCTVYDVKRSGILVMSNWNSPLALEEPGYGKNVTIRNNTLHHIWGDGIIAIGMDGGVIEHNVAYETNLMSYTNEKPSVNVGIWGIHSKNLVYRFNESYLCRTTLDGYGYDIDGDNDNITFEYNYSHDNDGGFMLLVNHNNSNALIRYNISQNDHQYQIACAHFPQAHPTIWDFSGKIYNNTFYAKEPGKKKIILMLGRPRHTEVYNNIFYIEADEVSEIPVDYTYNVERHHNLYYFGNSKNAMTIDEPYAIVGKDPKFIAAGSGKLGIDTLSGYKLFEDSPALGSGYLVEDNGGRDYFGNEVSQTEAPNIGAYGGEGISYESEEAIRIAEMNDIHMKIGDNKITIKGEETQIDKRNDGAVPFIKDGYAMVPLRKVAEALDAEVEWQFETRKTIVKGVGLDMEFVADSEEYTSFDEKKAWRTSPVSIDGIMYVPVRDLCVEAGETVVYNKGEIHITDNARVYE